MRNVWAQWEVNRKGGWCDGGVRWRCVMGRDGNEWRNEGREEGMVIVRRWVGKRCWESV